MKKINEMIVRKDSSIHKVQFDKDWFYSIEDMEDFLKEDLSAVEAISLPMVVYGEEMVVKCATWEDIERVRIKPLDELKGSVLRNESSRK